MNNFKHIITIIFLIFFNISFSQKNECNEIYGKWIAFYEQRPFRAKEPLNLNSIWYFNENGNLLVNNLKLNYKLNKSCTEISLDENSVYSFQIVDNVLNLVMYILPHEQYILKLKKN